MSLAVVMLTHHSWVCPVSLATSLCLNLPWQHSFVIADMTCPMNVESHYVSLQHITEILGFDRHLRMAALRPPLKRGCQEVVPQIMELRHMPPSMRAPGFRLKRTGVVLELELDISDLN